MGEKGNDVFTLAVIVIILMAFAGSDFLAHVGIFSSKGVAENVPQPKATVKSVLSGDFFDEREEYLSGHFYNGAKWTKIVRDVEILLGKREFHEVYLGKKGSLFERHLAEEFDGAPVKDSLDYLEKLVQENGAKIMLIPTADGIWRDRLPAYADVFDQKAYLDKGKERIGEDAWIDAYSILAAHEEEPLYYLTDPHWTSLAAYYAYELWWMRSGERQRYYYETSRMETVSESFVGPLVKKSGAEAPSEQIQVFRETMGKQVRVTYDGREEKTGYYRQEYLNSVQGYDYFLGEFGFARIDVGNDQLDSLFVLGDSYANCMIPLLAPYYKTIYVLNVENYQGDADAVISRYAKRERTHFLVLQSVPGLLEGFSAGKERKID